MTVNTKKIERTAQNTRIKAVRHAQRMAFQQAKELTVPHGSARAARRAPLRAAYAARGGVPA